MITLGSKNFPVTNLKSNNYINLLSYCVRRKLIALSHSSMLMPWKFRTIVFIHSFISFSKIIQNKTLVYIYIHIYTHTQTHKHACICIHMCVYSLCICMCVYSYSLCTNIHNHVYFYCNTKTE